MVRLTDHLDMTIDVDWDVKPQHNNNRKPMIITVFHNLQMLISFFFRMT